MADTDGAADVVDYSPPTETFHEDVVAGLRQRPRSLPCKYFYDQRGSELFDAICEVDEYYVTRTELGIMRRHAADMAEQIGEGVMLIEYGSGASTKTRLLLAELKDPAAYVPVDISREHLAESAGRLAERFPGLEVLPVAADFTGDFELPEATRPPTHNAVYFPGSTIGNFRPAEAQAMLRRIVRLCGCGGGLLIGVDLQKEAHVLESAYNDAEGVTAAFNLNLLDRINRELEAEIDVDQFAHQAVYNPDECRIELSLVSQREQTVRVGDEAFDFDAGESIHTEYSHKYTVESFADLAAEAGLTLRQHWTDEAERFAVMHLAILDTKPR